MAQIPTTPQATGVHDASAADYGRVRVGSAVMIGRHRPVNGSTNWNEEMSRHIGRVGLVCRLSGIDSAGCPGVRVTVDHKEVQFFFRLRDCVLLCEDAQPPQATALKAAGPADYGNVHVGSVVLICHHRGVNGDANWGPHMEQYVEKIGVVRELSGVDGAGCPGVRVTVNHEDVGAFFRIRDLVLLSGGVGEGSSGSGAIPQDTGVSDADPVYRRAGISIGTRLIIGRHTPVNGDANWNSQMDRFVGRIGVVRELSGVDGAGCPGIRFSVDGEQPQFFFRLRDCRRADGSSSSFDDKKSFGDISFSTPSSGAIPQDTGVSDADPVYHRAGISIGTRLIIGRHTPVNGDANWNSQMDRFVGRIGVVRELSGVDSSGCPGMRFSVDGEQPQFFFRLRDCRRADGSGASGASFNPIPPQETGVSAASARYGDVQVGSAVVIQRHRPVNGDMNWNPSMDQYVGKIGIVKTLSGVDGAGCPGVRVEMDGKEVGYFFRLRDMLLLNPRACVSGGSFAPEQQQQQHFGSSFVDSSYDKFGGIPSGKF